MDIVIGAEIPTFSRTTDLEHWNRYAAVNDEFVPIHMDDEGARANGLPAAIGMGNLRYAYLHNLLRAWVGPNGRLVRIACQYRGYNFRHDTLTCHGKIAAVHKRDDGVLVDLDLWIENDRGEVITPGTATVMLASGAVS